MEAKWIYPPELVRKVMRRIYERELTTLTGGNISMMDGDTMWVTPTGIDKKNLDIKDIVRVFKDGTFEGIHRPTSEYRIHHRIQMEHPEIKAVVHAHSPALVSMSVLHKDPETALTYQSFQMLGDVGLTDYAKPGTLELVDCVAETFKKGYRASILKNHAAFLGSTEDLLDGFKRFEMLDWISQLSLLTWKFGKTKTLTKEKMDLFSQGIKRYAGFIEDHHDADELEARAELVEFAKRCYSRKLFTCGFGSISKRTEHGFLISPDKVDNEEVSIEQFVYIENGKCEGGKIPDRFAKMHDAIYEAHPEINSIFIAAPLFATAFAVTDLEYNVYLLPESYGVLRSAKKIPFDLICKDQKNIAECIDIDNPFGIIENLGVIVVGDNLPFTFDKLEVAEFTARSIIQSLDSNFTINPLTKEECEEA